MTQIVSGNSVGPVVATDQFLSASFLAAFLLTGSTFQAEAAVLRGIASLTFAEEPKEQLFEGSVVAALEANRSRREASDGYCCPAAFPVSAELLNVLHLSVDLRECFALRTLDRNVSRTLREPALRRSREMSHYVVHYIAGQFC